MNNNDKRFYLEKNACYIKGQKHTVNSVGRPIGIMLHGTGADNKRLSRYIGPDDGFLGENKYDNHWNKYHAGGKDIGPHAYVNKNGDGKCDVCGGREVCVHGFIGTLEDGTVAYYQTLPYEMQGWHCAGKANDGYVGIELCEDDLTDPVYFEEVYNKALFECDRICRMYCIPADMVISHKEGHKKGIASNHGDVDNWFKKQGKTMDDFRKDLSNMLDGRKQITPCVIDGINKQRLADELILYVGLPSTGTNEYGTEAIINPDMTVASVKYGVGNNVIPPRKMVLSGHGKASKWILENLERGAEICLKVHDGFYEK